MMTHHDIKMYLMRTWPDVSTIADFFLEREKKAKIQAYNAGKKDVWGQIMDLHDEDMNPND